jgi:hypothetical protein
MTKHKTEDYKNSAVKYYLTNEKGDGYKRTCKILREEIENHMGRHLDYKQVKQLTTPIGNCFTSN